MPAPQLPRPEFCILGPLRVYLDGVEVRIAARRQRALLQLLLLNVGRVVPTERLIDQLWDGTPPPQAAVTLRSYVSTVRHALGGREGSGTALITKGQGYALDVPPEAVDAVQLRVLAERGRAHLRSDEVQPALTAFDAAVALWVGDPLAEIADHEVARSALAQLTETYLGAVEGRFEALLANGRHADAIPSLEAFAREQPLREAPTALLMLALYRAGRTAEALAVHRRFRHLLREELGIDPSARVEELLRRILAQDPGLDAPARVREPAVTTVEAPAADPPAAAEVDTTRSLPTPRTDMVGRSREMSVMQSRLDVLVGRRTGSLLLIAGEPGVGKTTLLEALETRARASGAAVYRGRCPAATGGPAFWLWSQVIEALAARLTDDELTRAIAGAARPVAQLSHVVAERAGHPVPLIGDDAQALRFLLYEGVSTFIHQATDGRPTVITLDDIHWADLPSLELLAYLTPALADRALLLVAAYRDLQPDRSEALEATLATVSREDTADELAVAGLDHDEVASLARALDLVPSGAEQAGAFVTALHERTAGNPFFVRQLARHMSETAAEGAGPDTVPVPAGVHHVIASRLRRLSDPTTDLLAGAAVVGRDFDLRSAAAAAGLAVEEALDALDEATRHGLVEPTGDDGVQARFTHALMHEVVLDQVPAGRRARLHARVAEHLVASGASVDQLAEHLWAARAITGASAVPAQLAAAAAADAVFAYERSEMHLRRALHLVESSDSKDPHVEITVLLRLFRLITAVRGWGNEDAHELVERARQLSVDSAVRDDAVRLWWSVFFFLLDRDDAASYALVARTLLSSLERRNSSPEPSETPPDHATLAAIHIMNVYADLADNQREAAERHLEAARAHVEAAMPPELAVYDEHLHVMLLVIESGWAALTGDAARHASSASAAIALADADGRPFPRAVARTLGAANALYGGGLPTDALEAAAEAHELSSRFSFAWLATLAEAVQKWAEASIGGNAADAIAFVSDLLHDVEQRGRHGPGSLLQLLLADLYAIDGRTAAARETLVTLRNRPGPYRCLVVDLVNRKLHALH